MSTDEIRRVFVMPVWQVALVLNLTFAVGLGLGYAGWGRRAEALDRELEATRAEVERLERERAACASGAGAGEQQWEGRGVVRAVYPQLLVVTHEEIRGLLPARTTSFRTASPKLPDSIRVGDAIRFSLRGTLLDDVTLVAIERW
jgi:Copper binding periplasmic protein CusF